LIYVPPLGGGIQSFQCPPLFFRNTTKSYVTFRVTPAAMLAYLQGQAGEFPFYAGM